MACSSIDPDHLQLAGVSPLSEPLSLNESLQPPKSFVPLPRHIVQPSFRLGQTGGAGNKPHLASTPPCLNQLSSFKHTQMTRYRLPGDRQIGGQRGD